MEEKKKPVNLHAGHRKRVRERYLTLGEEAFSDHQLLELLLFYALPRKDTNELAHVLLNHFGSLEGVFRATVDELCHVEGISESSAALIHLVPDLYYRCQKSESRAPVIKTREDAAEYLRPYFEHQRKEMAYFLSVGENGKVLGCDLIGAGGDSEVYLDVNRMIEAALRHRACWCVMAHSHPSGIAMPSPEDLFTTRQCRLLLQQVGIDLRDHVVFADDDYYCMADSPGFF